MKKAQYAKTRAIEKQLKALEKQLDALNAQGRELSAEHRLATVNCDHKFPTGKTIKCSHACKHKICTICQNEVDRPRGLLAEVHAAPGIPGMPPLPSGLAAALQKMLGPGVQMVEMPIPLTAANGFIAPTKKKDTKTEKAEKRNPTPADN